MYTTFDSKMFTKLSLCKNAIKIIKPVELAVSFDSPYTAQHTINVASPNLDETERINQPILPTN